MEFIFKLKHLPVFGVSLILVLSAALSWTLFSSRASESAPATNLNDATRKTRSGRTRENVADVYRQLPMSFEENRGQTDPQVKFSSRGSGSELFLTSTGAVLALRNSNARADRVEKTRRSKNESTSFFLRMSMIGANPAAEVAGCDRLPGNNNYLRGADPGKWRSNIPTYERVRYRDLYPGVNLVYYGNQRQLEYDFEVAPGGDPGVIRIAFEGADAIRIDKDGDLILRRSSAEVRMRRPSIYQDVDGTRQTISGHYVRKGRRQVGFEVGAYDKSQALVIDPVLTYSTFLGGNSNDYGRSIALDADGNAYVTGQTSSFNFPATINSYSSTYVNGQDVFVTKLNAAGTAIIYSTYVGGSSDESGLGIALDSTGYAYITGYTYSTNYPTTPMAYQTTMQGGSYNYGDAFVTKVNTDGTALVYSTYLGGMNSDGANGIAVDAAGNAYVAGYTYSDNFPTTAGVLQTGISTTGIQEAFVTELNPTGTALVYSTYLGGSGADQATAIKVDSSGNAYVAGMTTSTNFDITPGAYQTTYGGGSGSPYYYNPTGDGFASKLNPTGTALLYSTYLGGVNDDACLGLALASSGEVYLTGVANSGNFPTTPGVVRVGNGGVVKSTNGAGSWFAQNSGLTSPTELSLAIDPLNPNVIFTGSSGGGVFKSTNGGGNWAAANVGLTDSVIRSITIDPTTTSTMYLGTNTRGVFRSTDSGATWRAINTGQNGMGVNTIKVDPSVSSRIYAGTDSGIFRTTNGGATWAASSTGLNQGVSVGTLAIDPTAPSTIYAGLNYYSGGLYKSTNGGGNWSATSLTGVSIKSLVLDPLSPSTIYAGSDTGVQKSTDGGSTWISASIALANKTVNALAISPADSNTIYAGTGNGVFKSTSGGATWTLVNTGLAGAVVNAIAIDPLTPLSLYCGSAFGSTDGFVTKLNATGTALDYSTYLGGYNFDQASAIAIDAAGNAYVTGSTQSQNFPTIRGGFDVFSGYSNDAFVTKLDPAGLR